MGNVFENSILLIGPPSVGKSSLSRILSEKTSMPTVSLDDSRDKYYYELGYDRNYANKLKMEEGILARYKYWKQFEAHHVSKFLPNIPEESIIKFEASQTVYEDPELFMKVSNEIKKYNNVILLLPDIDLHESWRLVNKIGKVPVGSDLSKLNWHLISSPCNGELATFTTCIAGRTSEEVADEIINFINSKKKAIN
ncbi:MAG: hypothetical protein RSB77_05330 [Bacilli bacterium]